MDDIIVGAKDKQTLEAVKRLLSERFKMTDLGPINHILGLRVERRDDCLSLDQKHYIESVVRKFGMEDAKTVSTPLDTSVKLVDLKPGEKLVDKTLYRSAVGSLMFAAIATRPDISAAVGIVSRHMERPGEAHWTAVKRIFRYLKGTASLGLVYR